MSDTPARQAKGRPAPVLVLCRNCVEYVFAGTDICPHCGRDANAVGPRYRDGGYEAIEAMRRVDDVLRRRQE
jgi:hypothetical protein